MFIRILFTAIWVIFIAAQGRDPCTIHNMGPSFTYVKLHGVISLINALRWRSTEIRLMKSFGTAKKIQIRNFTRAGTATKLCQNFAKNFVPLYKTKIISKCLVTRAELTVSQDWLTCAKTKDARYKGYKTLCIQYYRETLIEFSGRKQVNFIFWHKMSRKFIYINY